VLAAIRQSADALTDVRSLEHQQGQQQKALASADHAFRLAEERYRLGLSGQIPMLTAEATLLDARRQTAALRARTAIGRVTLLLSVGGGMRVPETRTATNSATPAAQASAKP
jgi:outer membrane protein TolC